MLVSLLQSNKWRPKWHQNVTTSSQPIFRRLATSNEEHVKKPSNQVVTNRPNLKRAGKSGNPKVVIVGCILVALYMYPMIFKPMFSIGISARDQQEKIKKSGVDMEKSRPSFMPRWTSPFGPRNDKDE